MSLEEYFCEGPKIRVPPCSLPPFAGAHVGRAAVVIGFHVLGIEFDVTDFLCRYWENGFADTKNRECEGLHKTLCVGFLTSWAYSLVYSIGLLPTYYLFFYY